MKHYIKKMLVALLSCLLIFPALGVVTMGADGSVDFYAQVSSREGSINFRTGAGTGFPVIREIPNGQILHIVDMSYNAADGFFFGKTDYQGSSGWVSLRQTVIMTGQGYPAPDFLVVVSAKEGSLNLRQGPGTNYPKIMEIPNGVQLHITNMQYNANDDFFFGNTSYNGVTGWVSLRHTTMQNTGGQAPAPTPAPGTNGAPGTGTAPQQAPSGNPPAAQSSTGSDDGVAIQFGSSSQPAGELPQEAKAAYLKLLQDNRSLMDYDILNQYYEGKIIAFADITGDGIDEMLCVYVTIGSNSYQNGKYRIASWNNGTMSFITTEDGKDLEMFGPASIGCEYPFQVSGNNHLFLKGGRKDAEGLFDRVVDYSYENGMLHKVHSCEYNPDLNAPMYRIDDSNVSEADAAAQLNRINTSMDQVLAGTMAYYAFAPSVPPVVHNVGMTYDEAIAFLQR